MTPHPAPLVSQSEWERAWDIEAAGRTTQDAARPEPSVIGLADVIRPLVGTPATLVEIGAAGGKTLAWLRHTFPRALAVGLDFSVPGLRLAARTNQAGTRLRSPESEDQSRTGVRGFHLVAARFEAAPFRSGAFDLAASFGLLEHFVGAARIDCFAAHTRMVGPGGSVLVTVPNRHAFVYRAHQFIAGFLCRRLPAVARALGINFVKEDPLGADELFRLADHFHLQRARVFESDGRADLRRVSLERLLGMPRRGQVQWREVPRDARGAGGLRGRTLALVARVADKRSASRQG